MFRIIHNRVLEANCNDGMMHDLEAVRINKMLNYDFTKYFLSRMMMYSYP